MRVTSSASAVACDGSGSGGKSSRCLSRGGGGWLHEGITQTRAGFACHASYGPFRRTQQRGTPSRSRPSVASASSPSCTVHAALCLTLTQPVPKAGSLHTPMAMALRRVAPIAAAARPYGPPQQQKQLIPLPLLRDSPFWRVGPSCAHVGVGTRTSGFQLYGTATGLRPRAIEAGLSAGRAAVSAADADGGGDESREDGAAGFGTCSEGPGSTDSIDGSSSSGSSPCSDFILTTRGEDTIASIVTGSMTHGSVAIIRVSGSDAVSIASRVFRPGGRFRFGWQPESHRVYYGTAVDGDERLLDEVLLLVMLSPRSYTAEDVVELHCHGGGVCAGRVMRALIEAGARLAKPGEFTLRAFLNGRLDLAQAEAVSELVTARTPAAADSALAGLRGGVGGAVSELRSRCLDVLAELEARLDFDEDLPPIDVPELKRKIERIQAGIEQALRTVRAGTLLRNGLQVAIVGRPNVGKSSLLNAWTNSERAIVTDVAGTTRDVLEATLSVGGVPVTLLDTAGMRQSEDVVERIGVERSQAAAAAADIVIMVVDGSVGWTDSDSEILRALWGDGPGSSSCKVKGLALLVVNKDDLRTAAASASESGAGDDQVATATTTAGSPRGGRNGGGGGGGGNGAAAEGPAPSLTSTNLSRPAGGEFREALAARMESLPLPLPLVARETFAAVVRTSAAKRRGLEALDAELLRLAGAPKLAAGGVSWSVNERQAEALVRSHEALMRLTDSIGADLPLDFWTIDLRAALLALGEVGGDEVAEEVLDAVFSRFCIGK